MPLPPSDPSRQFRHRRTLEVQAFERADGLWEIDARVTDVKGRSVFVGRGIHPAGEPVHDLMLRLVVDLNFNILQAGSESRSVPYPGHCEAHGDIYARLVGLNLMQGFRHAVRERVGGAQGCTHLTELATVLPTAVVQSMVGEVIHPVGDGDEKPFQLDRCHALVTTGEVVRLHYPRWFRQPGANNLSQNPPPVNTPSSAGVPETAPAAPPLSS
jgi:Protein of unknown function (DUF2889)